MALTDRNKVTEYVNYFGVSYEDAYYELIDMGEIAESSRMLLVCKELDKSLKGGT